MEYLSGVVERITYSNPENGFCVIKIKTKGFSDLVTVVGNLSSVNVGAVVRLKGEWKHDSKYGKQFTVVDYQETIPATIAGIKKYLGSGLIKGIGPVYAQKIVNYFKEDALKVIEETPDELKKIEGIGNKRVEMIKAAWQEQKEIKNVMLFLQSNGVSTAYAVKIYKTYGNESIKIVQENPYKLADDVWGIGFKTADRIARNMGYDLESSLRCQAGIKYVLNEFSNQGNCYATRDELLEEAAKILEVGNNLVEDAVDRMIEKHDLIVEKDNEDLLAKECIYLPPFYYGEVGTTRRILEILNSKAKPIDQNVNKVIKEIQQEQKLEYDEVQRKAIQTAVQSKFMVLTGGPGTGKTTITKAIIKIFKKINYKVFLAAPTGRAAKKMSEATGMEAKTIHRLLEYKLPEGYQRNAENPLECDVLILDEVSMVDILLMYNLLKALPVHVVVVLVGDVDQLPSVGPGNVLRDIIDSGVVKVIQLSKIYRQAKGSSIVTNAHLINRGKMPKLKGKSEGDFFFIEEEDPSKAVDIIVSLCVKRLPKYYRVDSLRDIQVLSPMQKGETGVQNMNLVLQQALNPFSPELKYGSTVYRLKDRVMQIKNNYEKSVFNGDIGIITKLDQEEKILEICFDGRKVEYDVTELDEVVLAYAATIHKSQGSEYPVVVAPIKMQHYVMLQRNLLYTCVTRAKRILVLVGSKKAIGIAVTNNRVQKRNTLLSWRLSMQISPNS